MRTQLRTWLPTVIALVALVLALDGPALAKGKLNGKSIKKGTVASKQLKDGTITTADVQDGGLTGLDLADGSVTGADVANDGLTAADLAPGAVGEGELDAGSVTAPKLAANSVTGPKLATDSVTPAKLAKGSVTGLALEAAGTALIDFPSIAANGCVNQPLATLTVADGSLSDDVVIATPDSFFGGNFSFSVKSEGPGAIYVKMCNVGAVAADPDGGGGGKTWRWAAIDLG